MFLVQLFAFDPHLTSTGLPLKHRPTMTLTRSMCAKLASQQPVGEVFETPPRNMKSLTTPESSFASPRKLPTPPTAQRFICHVCRNDSTLDSNISLNSVTLSKFNDFVQFVNKKFNEIELQFDNIGDQINTIVQSIMTHKSIISELEREIADLSDPHKSFPSSACASTTLSRTAPPSLSSSAPPCRSASTSASPCRSAPPSLSTSPSPSIPPTRPAPLSRSVHPSRSSPSTSTTRSAPPSRSAPPTHPAPPVLPLLPVLPHQPVLPLPLVLPLPPVLSPLPVLPLPPVMLLPPLLLLAPVKRLPPVLQLIGARPLFLFQLIHYLPLPFPVILPHQVLYPLHPKTHHLTHPTSHPAIYPFTHIIMHPIKTPALITSRIKAPLIPLMLRAVQNLHPRTSH